MSLANDKRRNWQGGKWIQPLRRLAIYVRDGFACAYCGASVEQDGVRLSLDHCIPEVRGGDNANTNLVTCCTRCNSAKGARTVAAFCRAVAEYFDNGMTAKQIERHVRVCAKRDMGKPTIETRELMVRRVAAKVEVETI